jgi:NADPH:quinone reductase-like Zn-dependent oxidoreductase
VSGTVDAVGAGVTGVAVGDLVFGTADWRGAPLAGASDRAVMDQWTPVPAGLGVRDTFHEAEFLPFDRPVVFAEFAQLAAAGKFTVPIAATCPLTDWSAAMELSLSGQPGGKLLLLP